MYAYLTGNITHIAPTSIELVVNDIGYEIFVANPFQFTVNLNQKMTFFVYQAVREDAITLYGFASRDEKELFLKLTSVSGIGPKSALSILSAGNNEGLISAIESENITYLTKFPGVGKKTAGQIILDLKGKLTLNNVEIPDNLGNTSESILQDAKSALIGLGYSEREIKKIMPLLEKETFDDSSAVLKRAFTLLLK